MTPFLNKYPPQTLDECIFPDQGTEKRIRQYANGTRTDSIILYGPNGTGKSTTARLMVEAALGVTNFDANRDIMEVNAVKQRGEHLYMVWNAQFFFAKVSHGLFVIEEGDRLTDSLQHSVASTIASCPHMGSIIITTNHKHLLQKSLVDRCDTIEFPALTADAVLKRAQQILSAENVVLPDSKVLGVLETATGSIRDMMRALEDLCIEYRRVHATKSGLQPALS